MSSPLKPETEITVASDLQESSLSVSGKALSEALNETFAMRAPSQPPFALENSLVKTTNLALKIFEAIEPKVVAAAPKITASNLEFLLCLDKRN